MHKESLNIYETKTLAKRRKDTPVCKNAMLKRENVEKRDIKIFLVLE